MVLIGAKHMDMTSHAPNLRPWNGDEIAARSLRAAGMPEACLVGEWSDYDTLEALCAALPSLCGHPVGARLTAWLGSVTACDLPACAENAPALWQSFAHTHGYGASVALPDEYRPRRTPPPLPAPEILYEPDRIDCLGENVWSALLAEAEWPHDGRLLAACTDRLERWIENCHGAAWLDLPRDIPFVRPDPYHAELALQSPARGEAPSNRERGLLMAQLSRIVGQGIVRRSASSATLVLSGGDADAVLALCRYLDGCGGLPPTVWLAESPADAATLCGQFAAVRTGLRLKVTDTTEDVKRKLTAYATAAPLGRIVLGVPAWASHLDVTIADVYSAVLSDIE